MIRTLFVFLTLLGLSWFALVDFSGSRPTAPVNPARQRIVSLAPSFTEILLYLGAESRLVGCTDYCEGVDASVPRLGTFMNPKFEELERIRPDVVLMVASQGQSELARGLERAGIAVEVHPAESIDDLRAAMRAIGESVGALGRADAFVTRLDRALSAPPPTPGAPHVLFVVDRQPRLFVAGGTSFVHRMLRAAGAHNSAGDYVEPWRPISIEDVVRRDPDLIVDASFGSAEDGEAFWSKFRDVLPPAREGEIVPFPPVRCGVQLPDWIEALREIVAEHHRRRTRATTGEDRRAGG